MDGASPPKSRAELNFKCSKGTTGPLCVFLTDKIWSSAWPFTLMLSWITSSLCHLLSVKYSVSSSFNFSCHKSEESTRATVTLQEMSLVRPIPIPGYPGSWTPEITWPSGHSRWNGSHYDGKLLLRCGSLAWSGMPVAVWSPWITQLLLASCCPSRGLSRPKILLFLFSTYLFRS